MKSLKLTQQPLPYHAHGVDFNADVHIARYAAGGSIAIQLTHRVEEDGNSYDEPLAVATVNRPETRLPSSMHFWIKTWSENFGIYEWLEDEGIIEATNIVEPVGYGEARLARLHPKHEIRVREFLASDL